MLKCNRYLIVLLWYNYSKAKMNYSTDINNYSLYCTHYELNI